MFAVEPGQGWLGAARVAADDALTLTEGSEIIVEDWSDWLFPLFVLASAVGLTVWHICAWRWSQRQDLTPKERSFRWRQFRRRIQTSAMLAVLAAVLFIESWVTSPVFKLALGVGMLVLVCWLAALAVTDFVATRHHLARLRDGYLVEQVKLEVEAKRLRSLHGNGKPRPGHPASDFPKSE
jgi:hypothetical protein